MRNRHLYILCGILGLTAIAAFLYKALVVDLPIWPESKTESWEIEVRVRLAAEGGPMRVTLQVPTAEARFAVLAQHHVAPGYGMTSRSDGPNRLLTFAIRKVAGEQNIYLRVVLNRGAADDGPRTVPEPAVEAHGLEGAELAAAEAIIEEARRKSADPETFVPLIIEALARPQPDGPAAILLGRDRTERAAAAAIVRVLSVERIAARMVHGVRLGPNQKLVAFRHWIEVFVGKEWVPFDLTDATRGIPGDYLSWWRGDEPLVRVAGGTLLDTRISMVQLEESALINVLALASSGGRDMFGFSLFSLPLRTQEVYRLILMIPVGIFLLVLLRNVVGIATFGTFMPVLIALAFRETQLLWGIALFTIVVGAGLLVRIYLERLKLLLVPRLASVLIVVVLLMTVISVVAHKLGLDRGLSVALFPMVIMTMTIERMSIVWDERGPGEAFKQAAGSLFVAVVCYAALTVREIEHLLFVFPELLLLLLALTLLLGRYTGYRLTELVRFKTLARS